MTKSFLTIFSALFFCAQATAQVPSSEILQSLQELNTLGSVLYVAAHPDDENTRLLAYLAKERHMRTAYLSITRGDGGQNLIGSEQGEMLGLIRTEELLAARRVDGAEQWFTRANDFGYSKNPEETFRFWNKDSVLADVVYAIRKFRPDVIICRFPTTGEGGHGHHTASAILALEAFSLAADPSKFPEQLKTVQVWQAKRVFWNTFNFGGANTTAPNQLKIDVGVYNALLGKSYGEIAANSRSMHKSQGFGSAMQRGSQLEYFKLLKGDTVQNDLFDGVSTSWNRLPGTSKITKQLQASINTFDAMHPEKSLKALAKLYNEISALPESDENTAWWKKQKLKALQNIMLQAAGVFAETVSKDFALIPGHNIDLSTQVLMRNKANVVLASINLLELADTTAAMALKQNKNFYFKRSFILPSGYTYSNPYWLDVPHSNGLYSVANQSYRGKPQNDGLPVFITWIIEGIKFTQTIDIKYKSTDPVKGEVYRPIEVLPLVTVTPIENVLMVGNKDPKHVFFSVKANADNVKGKLELSVEGNTTLGYNWAYSWVNSGDLNSPSTSIVTATAIVDNARFSQGIKRISYDHIPYRFVLNDAKIKVQTVDVKLVGKNIGYIPGAGDNVAACLKQMGYQVTELSNEQLKNSNLSVYDAIITGVRAYNTNEQLPLVQKQLMDYVKNGGRLLVQYNTNSRVGPLQAGIGPYKFTISRNRVTNEEAEVLFVNDSAKVLNYPNHIVQADFKNWVQERGIYFATDLDSNYQTVFKMKDPNEELQNGSLIMANYGKGYFVYTGLAFFRQLPAGVPGAYKLFVNLISQPVKP
jgi:LmbE family N-acetylglucosaminyl deacetylase